MAVPGIQAVPEGRRRNRLQEPCQNGRIFFEDILQGHFDRKVLGPLHQGLPDLQAVFQPEIHIVVETPPVVTGVKDNHSGLKVGDQIQDLAESKPGHFADFLVYPTRAEIHEGGMEGYGNASALDLPGRPFQIFPSKGIERPAVEINFRLQAGLNDAVQVFQKHGKGHIHLGLGKELL